VGQAPRGSGGDAVSAPIEPGLDTDIAVHLAMGREPRWLAESPRWQLRANTPIYSTDMSDGGMGIVDELTALGASVKILALDADSTHCEVWPRDAWLALASASADGPPARALPLALCRARLHTDVVAWVERQRAARAEGGAS